MAILLPFPRLNLPTLLKVSYQNLSPNLFRFLMIMFVFTELAVQKQGHPTSIFRKISVRKTKFLACSLLGFSKI